MLHPGETANLNHPPSLKVGMWFVSMHYQRLQSVQCGIFDPEDSLFLQALSMPRPLWFLRLQAVALKASVHHVLFVAPIRGK